MSIVKVPEFKVGETITSEKFNEAFDQFKRENLSLNGDNFADQAFGFDQIPNDISLTDRDKFTDSFFEFTTRTMEPNTKSTRDPWVTPYTNFSGLRHANVNHPADNLIQLKNLSAGDKFIIRASCVIDTVDGGWRTYMFGIPPIVKIGLVRFGGQTSADFGGDTSNVNTFPIQQTLAHYRIAFTGKVPSASSYYSNDVGYGFYDRSFAPLPQTENNHRDTRLVPGTAATEEYGSVIQNPFMPFDGFHSYSTTYLYSHGASDSSTQSFGIMCSEIGGKVGYKPDGSGSGNQLEGGDNGCKDPTHQHYKIRNFNLFAYQVKK